MSYTTIRKKNAGHIKEFPIQCKLEIIRVRKKYPEKDLIKEREIIRNILMFKIVLMFTILASVPINDMCSYKFVEKIILYMYIGNADAVIVEARQKNNNDSPKSQDQTNWFKWNFLQENTVERD